MDKRKPEPTNRAPPGVMTPSDAVGYPAQADTPEVVLAGYENGQRALVALVNSVSKRLFPS